MHVVLPVTLHAAGGDAEEAAAGRAGEEGEEEELRPEQQRLKQLISSTLSGHLRQLKVRESRVGCVQGQALHYCLVQVAVEDQLGEHEKRLTERIAQLEASTTGRAKKK